MRVALFTNNYLPFRGGGATPVQTLRAGCSTARHLFVRGGAARRPARRQDLPLVFTYHTRYEKYAHYVPLPQRLVAALAVRLSCRFANAADLVVAPAGGGGET